MTRWIVEAFQKERKVLQGGHAATLQQQKKKGVTGRTRSYAEEERCYRADTQLRCNEPFVFEEEERCYRADTQLRCNEPFVKKKKKGVTGRTRSYAATNPWNPLFKKKKGVTGRTPQP
jgi:hypothetical protein